MRTQRTSESGVTILLVVAYMGIFALVLGTITSYAFMQARYGRALLSREQAIQIAEAGLEHYRWFLAHTPTIMQTGAGLDSPATYVVDDPEGSRVGEAEITTQIGTACGVPQWADIVSIGKADFNPAFKRSLSARYMRPSVAEYSHIVGESVWAGSDRNITGAYHSNQGVRMDGTNNSDVTSSVATWNCTGSFGCSPTNSSAPGVVGSGPNNALWSYPMPQISFAGIGANFGALRGYAYADGILLSGTTTRVNGVQQGGSYASVAASDRDGYHLIFNSNGTVTVYRVTDTSSVTAYNGLQGWYSDYVRITSESSLGTFTPPSDCALIYVNAKTWIEGTVSGKITVIAADTGSFTPDVVLDDNITYASADGTSGLTVVAERSVLVGLEVPNTMTIRGIFVAQGGWFGRNLYHTDYLSSSLDQYAKRSQLTTNGSVVSSLRVGTKWLCSGSYCSGFNARVDNYDRVLAFSPPPFTPAASQDFKFVLWREQ